MARNLEVADVRCAIAEFSSRDRSRGDAYYAARKVRSFRRDVDVDGDVVFSATVQGSARSPYRTTIVFESSTGELVDAECTCPVGFYCKHCVATLRQLEQEVNGPTSPGGLPRDFVRTNTPPVDPRIEAWLQALTASSRSETPVEKTAASDERLVYTISLAARAGLPPIVRLHVDRAVVEADGSVGRRRMVNASQVDWMRDPAVSPGDHALVVRMGPLSMGYAVLDGVNGARILSDLVATGRAFLEAGDVFVRLVEGAARMGQLTFASDSDGSQWPTVSVEGATDVLPVSPPHYVDASTGATGPVSVPGASDAFAHAWLHGSRIPAVAAAQVAQRLAAARLPARPPSPRVRRVREIDVPPTLVLRLESKLHVAPVPYAYGGYTPSPPSRPWARVFFDYGGERVDPSAPVVERATDDELVRVRRREAAETEFLTTLADGGLFPVQRMFQGFAMPKGTSLTMSSKVPSFAFASQVAALMPPGGRVEKAPDYAFDAVSADEVVVGLDELPTTEDHFAVSVGIRVGDKIFAALPLVLAALRERLPEENESLLVTLPDGRTVEVSAALLAPIRRLLVELLAERNPSHIPRVRALAIDPAVLARSPGSLEKLRASLASPRRIAVPRKLRATLREYQREGFVWLMVRRRAHLGAVLADDMGLGKTVQTLALLLAEERDGVPSLVVCPKSVLGIWEAEAKRFAPSLRFHVHHGPDRATRLAGFETADVVLTTYALLTRDTELFQSRRFASAVLDEAQTIKTAGSTFTHAACALRAEFRLALSGTPMENHLGELWSIMRFALPELFGESRTFMRGFRRPIERTGSDSARHELIHRLSPFVLRRRKEQVAAELPPKTVVVESIELEDAQRTVYETVRAAMDTRVRQAMAERGIGKSHIIILDALLKLRQAVCDPRLLATKTAKKAGSAKLEVLMNKLKELVAEGRRVLVFSQFVAMLELVQPELRRAKIPFLLLTGQTQRRAEVVEAFQRGDAPVFLLSLKAGGTGLNLTAADVVIHYDPWWNPAAEAQATDRAHRIGQDKPVLVYKLVGKGTIEEKILVLQEKKRALFTSIMDDGAGVAKKLTAADVEFLFAR